MARKLLGSPIYRELPIFATTRSMGCQAHVETFSEAGSIGYEGKSRGFCGFIHMHRR